MTADAWVLGLDGGGSKTRVAVAELGGGAPRVSAELTGRGGDLPSLGRDGMARHLGTLRRAVLHRAGVSPSTPLTSVALGLPGYGTDDAWDEALEQAAMAAFPDARLLLLNDVALAREAAFASTAGVLALAGTGAMAWARDEAGREATSGGWGFVFGDEGGGYDLAREALRAASRAVDGRGPDTVLAKRLPAALEVCTLGAAVHRLASDLSRLRAATAALAPTVLTAAGDGDEVAQALVRAAASSLVEQVRAAGRALGDPPLPVSGMGGLFDAGPYAAAFDSAVARAGLAPRLPPAERPVVAGLRLAAAGATR